MKKQNGISTRQMKRKLKVNPTELFSLCEKMMNGYEDMKGEIDENVLSKLEPYKNKTVSELIGELKGKINELGDEVKSSQEEIFESKEMKHMLTFVGISNEAMTKKNPNLKVTKQSKDNVTFKKPQVLENLSPLKQEKQVHLGKHFYGN